MSVGAGGGCRLGSWWPDSAWLVFYFFLKKMRFFKNFRSLSSLIMRKIRARITMYTLASIKNFVSVVLRVWGDRYFHVLLVMM